MKVRSILLGAALATSVGVIASSASATTVSLNFAGLNGNAEETVLNYYNGGTGGLGDGPGPNYGVSFSSNALACSVQPGGTCNSADLPTGGNLLFFLSGSASTMDVAAGFTTGFSFFYSTVNDTGFVNVWSGLDGTGTLLATLNLPTTPNGAGNPACFGANFCPYSPIGVSFAGTAMSVDFGGVENQVAFADITFGSSTPGGVPEPASWALMISGFGLAGAALRRRRATPVAA
jgi:hypothetical protein